MERLPQTISPWMDNLDYDWQPFIDHAQLASYSPGEHIYYQEDKATFVYIVLYGRVRLYMVTIDGQEKAITIAGKNCLFGEHRLQHEQVYLKNAVTASEVKVAKIAFQHFESILYEDTRMMRQFINLQNAKYCLAVKHNLQLSYGNSENRIRDAFYHLAKNYGKHQDSGITIQMEFTHQELANLIGTSRVTVANTISALLKNETLVKPGKFYHVPNLESLLNQED